jgi:hypothetical protein
VRVPVCVITANVQVYGIEPKTGSTDPPASHQRAMTGKTGTSPAALAAWMQRDDKC